MTKNKVRRINVRLTEDEYNVLVSRSFIHVILNGEEYVTQVPLSKVIRDLIDLVRY